MLQRLIRFAQLPPSVQLQAARGIIHRHLGYYLIERGWKGHQLGNDRTASVVGLFGTGREYTYATTSGTIAALFPVIGNLGSARALKEVERVFLGRSVRERICGHGGGTTRQAVNVVGCFLAR